MIIRPAEPEDASQISKLNAEATIGAPFSNIVGEPEWSHWLGEELTHLDHVLVLESEESPREICAVLLLRVNRQIYLRRTATIRVIVAPKYQSQGLGKELVDAALKLSDDELMMERIEVEVPTDNINALKLCKAAGFKVEGIAKDWMVSPDGRYVDAYLMAHYRDAKELAKCNKK